jgi:hypothetical protein
MRYPANPDATYPLPERTIVVSDDIIIPVPRDPRATGRILAWFGERYGYTDAGDFNRDLIEDEFMRDVLRMAEESNSAFTFVEGVVINAWNSCEHDPKYVPTSDGSQGSRYFTVQEMALETMKGIMNGDPK